MLLFVTKNLSQFRHFLGPFKRCAVPCRRHALSMIPFHPCRIPCHNGLQCAGRLPPETIGIEPGFRPKLKEPRSEEHTSELQSLMRISYAVFCLKKQKHDPHNTTNYQHNTFTSLPSSNLQPIL